MKVIVIVPTYNERENVGRLIDALENVFQAIPEHTMEILVVDDSSPDGTAEVVREKALQSPNVHLLLRSEKQGLGAAYLAAMDEAFYQLGAEAVMEMDCDFSHDPQKVPEFVTQLERGKHLVIGSRYIRGGSIPKDWAWHRKVLSVGGNLFTRLVMGRLGVTDWTTGYRALMKGIYEAVRGEMKNYRGYIFQISFLHKALQKGAQVGQVPINFVDRKYGKSKMGADYIKDALIFVVKARLQELWENGFLKVCLVGGVGLVVQTIVFETLLRSTSISPANATAIGAELAIINNFLLNNSWTFRRQALPLARFPKKFVQFNFVSLGSIAIQWLTLHFGTQVLGSSFWTVRALYLAGVLLGLIWNFTFYKKLIWRASDQVIK